MRLALKARSRPRGHVNRRPEIPAGCNGFHKNIEIRKYYIYLKLRDEISGEDKQ